MKHWQCSPGTDECFGSGWVEDRFEADTSQPAVRVVRGARRSWNEGCAGGAERAVRASGRDGRSGLLSLPTGALKKTPNLILISNRAEANDGAVEASELLGAVILYEYRISGIHTGTYATDDSTGRRTLVAPAGCAAGLRHSSANG